jgi:hypothetical protein
MINPANLSGRSGQPQMCPGPGSGVQPWRPSRRVRATLSSSMSPSLVSPVRDAQARGQPPLGPRSTRTGKRCWQHLLRWLNPGRGVGVIRPGGYQIARASSANASARREAGPVPLRRKRSRPRSGVADDRGYRPSADVVRQLDLRGHRPVSSGAVGDPLAVEARVVGEGRIDRAPVGVKNSDHPCDLRLRPSWPPVRSV